jgi:hypothetical protein
MWTPRGGSCMADCRDTLDNSGTGYRYHGGKSAAWAPDAHLSRGAGEGQGTSRQPKGDAHVSRRASCGQGIDKLRGGLTKAPVPFLQTLLSERSQVQSSRPIQVRSTGRWRMRLVEMLFGWRDKGRSRPLFVQVRFYARVVGGLLRAGHD